MTNNVDIYRSAAVLVREYGEDAALEAATRSDAMLEKGDLNGQAVWKCILAKVRQLQRREPPGGTRQH